MQKSIFHYLKFLFGAIKNNKFFPYLLTLNIFNSFYTIFVVFLSSEIIFHIERQNFEKIYFWIYIFVILTIVLIFVKIFYDGIYFIFHRRMEQFFVKKFFQKFLKLDNTATERYGVGRFSSVMNSGINASSTIFDGILFGFVQILMLISTFFIIFVKVPNIWYFI